VKVPVKNNHAQHSALLQTFADFLLQSDHQSCHGKLNQDLVLLDLGKPRQALALQAWHSTAQS